MPQNNYFIGLMSGTSADGVDAALIKMNQQNINQQHIELIDFISEPLPAELKQNLIALNTKPVMHLQHLALLQKQVADIFSQTTLTLLKKNHLKPEQITAIGSHGQTIYHAPEIPMSIQIGHPAFIAKTTGITTVGDFRIDDMALGGQGAPFAPVFHHQLFANNSPTFVINIGGIANISCLNSNSESKEIIGWDTGPGNALMDDVCQKQLGIQYDPSGQNASQGKINLKLLEHLLTHPYFKLKAPKSTGRETFHTDWVDTLLTEKNIKINTHDLLATLCELTAKTIAQQIQILDISTAVKTPTWIVGGGAYNDFLISRIQAHLPDCTVASSFQKGINPDAIEAMMFAWLAQQRIENNPIDLAKVTGAKRNGVLGAIWHS
ncbi:anhydro-N-acetylmuramic acid kinase [Thiomicrorhabdus sp.]|uniref:anhydro-N-acetylmuramic acid kinase n=1 Tax=Thiomicrorhabdus sp. TaxID=2039724 RepID=UPI002AA5E3A8|nr:anhydro-N-acetylmuramic acid kinase [Thiomicrorhabdus sp.]